MYVANYGIIGNCRSSALVSKYGSIDWCCLPDFDSSSIFASLLDDEKGGHFGISAKGDYSMSQKYITNTNILVTSFNSDVAGFEIIDFMPIYRTDDINYYNAPEIYRIVRITKGTPVIKVEYFPMLNYGMATNCQIERNYLKHISAIEKYESIYLYSNLNLELILKSEYFDMTEDCFFCIAYNQKLIKIDINRVFLEYQRTKVYWMNWTNRTLSLPNYNKMVIRSMLVLKLLSYDKSGAIIAAPTTSIPEAIGETRNWDYRFCWIRDSSMVIKTLLMMGHSSSAKRFLKYILSVNLGKQNDIQIMYGIRGERNLEEKVITHLKGFRNSPPVRTGNGAFSQKQHDIYGGLIESIYITLQKFPTTLDTTEELWTFVRGLVIVVTRKWMTPDKSIWEIRGPERHFVYSKVMSWHAINQGVKIAQMLDKDFYAEEWGKIADTIKEDIFTNGWDEEVGAFVQYYGSKSLDAAILLMEETGIIEAGDPRYVSTVLRVRESLSVNGFMYRYIDEDDFGRPSGSFILCNFWMVNSLFKIGHTEDAIKLFENIMDCANHLGLLSEHINADSRELLGNFPQAYSHLGLVQSALLINGRDIEFTRDTFKFIKP